MTGWRFGVFMLAVCALLSMVLMIYRIGQQQEYTNTLEQGIADIASEHNALLSRQRQDRAMIQRYSKQIATLNHSAAGLRESLNASDGCAAHTIEPDVIERVLLFRYQDSHSP